jgi:hypothetical protein
VIDEVSDVLRGDPEDWLPLEYGYQGYRKSVLGPAGARLHFDPSNATHFNISLPGKACQQAGNEQMKNFFLYCIENRGKARRIDLALDDFDKLITPQALEEQFHSPNAVTHVKAIMGIGQSEKGFPEGGGVTRYLGAVSSQRRLRIYDKNIESGGRINAIRWELQERKRAAEKSHHDMANGKWGEIIRRRLLSVIDIRLHNSAVEVEDRVRWEPYELLMQGAIKAAAYFPVQERSIEEIEEWFVRQNAPTLAMLLAHHGGDLGAIEGYASDGRKRLRPKHLALIASAKKKY